MEISHYLKESSWVIPT